MATPKFQPFDDLPPSQYKRLKDDIEARGIVNPILVDEHDKTIDGHQRRKVCADLGIECPRVVIEGLTDTEKMSLAIALNMFRRHLSGVERTTALHDLSKLGMSVRRIADATGLSKSQVHRDLSGVPSGTPENVDPETGEIVSPTGDTSTDVDTAATPARVTGKDGRSHPAKKPKAEPSPVAEFLSETDSERSQLRRRLVDALAQNGRLYEFDAAAAAEVLKPDEWVLWRQTARQSQEWFERLFAAEPKGLRVVGGGD